MQRNYAAMTKVRAMYGKHLTSSDYQALLQKRSVGEVAGYLKRETAYASQLREVREDMIHRGQLESLLHRRKLDLCLRLAKYSYSNDTFLRLFLLRSEVNLLLSVLRLMGTSTVSQLTAAFPAQLAKRMSFQPYEVCRAQTFDDLLDALQHTPYLDALLPLRPAGNQTVDIQDCETALLTQHFQRTLHLVNRRYSGATREALQNLLLAQANLHNLTSIYRLKRFFGSDSGTVQKHLISIPGTRLRPSAYTSLLEASDASAVLVRLRSTSMLQRFLREPEQDIEQVITSYLQATSRKAFRFSTSPVVVILSYLTLMDIETGNLIHIIEGIRYRVPSEEIRSLLIY